MTYKILINLLDKEIHRVKTYEDDKIILDVEEEYYYSKGKRKRNKGIKERVVISAPKSQLVKGLEEAIIKIKNNSEEINKYYNIKNERQIYLENTFEKLENQFNYDEDEYDNYVGDDYDEERHHDEYFEENKEEIRNCYEGYRVRASSCGSYIIIEDDYVIFKKSIVGLSEISLKEEPPTINKKIENLLELFRIAEDGNIVLRDLKTYSRLMPITETRQVKKYKRKG